MALLEKMLLTILMCNSCYCYRIRYRCWDLWDWCFLFASHHFQKGSLCWFYHKLCCTDCIGPFLWLLFKFWLALAFIISCTYKCNIDGLYYNLNRDHNSKRYLFANVLLSVRSRYDHCCSDLGLCCCCGQQADNFLWSASMCLNVLSWDFSS